MKSPLITIVIAAYNRPDALRTAVQSVVNQSVAAWKLYVIGDNCAVETAEMMKSFADDTRITYINLPDRFGEQSGPNSVGIGLCQTPFLAFLNHDDVWLEDHLKTGLAQLENGKVDFFLGGTAYSRFLEYTENGFTIHVDELVTDARSPVDFFRSIATSCEPASSWMMTNALAQKIGYWSYYAEVYRSPSEDYALRAWRMGARFYFSPTFTVWSVVTQYNDKNKKAYYQYESKEHAVIEGLVCTQTGDEVRELLRAKLYDWKRLEKDRKKAIKAAYSSARSEKGSAVSFKKALLYNSVTAWLFKVTGLDVFVVKSKIQGRPKGFAMNRLIMSRTGKIPEKPNKQQVIERTKRKYLKGTSINP